MDPTPPITVDDQLFLGRVEEQKQFRAALAEVLMQPYGEELPYIFLLHGIGGMGKTTLAKRFRDIASMEPPYEGDFQVLWIDWEEEARRSAALQVGRENVSPETVFQVMHAAAVRNKWGHHFQAYQKTVKARAEVDKEAAKALAASGDRDELEPIRAAGASVAAKLLRTAVPAIGDPGEKLAQELVKAGVKVSADQAVRIRALAESRLRARLDSRQYQLFLEPHEQLARALGEGLKQLAKGKWLLVVLDTYEIVDRADRWARVLMHTAGPRVVWVVSGRTNLRDSRQFGDEYFKGYADEFPRRFVAHNMGQLAAEYVREYLQTCVVDRPIDDAELEALGRATRGIPLAVRLAANLWEAGASVEDICGDIDDATPHQEIVRKVTDRYLMHAVAPADRLALFALALADGDLDELRAMLRPDDGKTYDLNAHLRRLERDYSSVHAETVRLHDEPAYFFLELLRTEKQRTDDAIRRLNERGAEALRARLARLGKELPRIEDRCDDDDWVRVAVRLADRLFWINEEQGWHWLIPCYVEGLAYSRELRRSLQQVADGWQKQMSTRGKKRVKALAGLDQWYELFDEDVVAGLDELDRLDRLRWLAGADEAERRAILALMRGRVLLRTGHTSIALAKFEAAKRGLPEDGEALQQQLGEALYTLAGELLWPGGRTHALVSAEAGGVLSEALVWISNVADAWYRLGTAEALSGRSTEAIAAYQQAIALDPKLAYPPNGLGNVYFNLGRNDEAIAAYQQATTLEPKFSDPYNGLGNVYRRLGRNDEAIAAYQQAIALDPTLPNPHNGLGNVYRNLGRSDEAIAAYQQAIALDPKSPNPYNALGNMYFDLDRNDEAIAAYQQAIALDSKLAYPHNGLGNVYRNLGRSDEAIAAYQQALSLPDNHGTPASAHTLSHNGLGNVNFDLGRNDEAIVAYQQAIALDPNYAYPHDGLGTVYYKLDRNDEAIAAYQQAIALNPQFAHPHNGLGNVYYKLGRSNEAIAAYQQAIALDPKYAYAHNRLGNVYFQLGRSKEAIAAYRKSYELQPSANSLNGLGEVYKSLGRADDAIAAYQQAIALDPKFGYPHISLAGIYRKLGDEEAYRKQVSLAQPLMGDVDDDYARACFASICGDVEEAIALLQAAVAKAPRSKVLAQRDPDFDFIRDDPRFQAVLANS